jgi:predicted nucleotidyltransferase
MAVSLDDAAVARRITYDEIAVLQTRYKGSFLSGSAARGAKDPYSDLDVHIVHSDDWWRLRAVRYEGRDVDIISTPVAMFEFQLDSRRRIPAQILAGAVIVDDPYGVVASLVFRAKALVAKPLLRRLEGIERLARHRPLSLLKDARDLEAEGDAAGVSFVVASICDLSINARVGREFGPLDVKSRYRFVRMKFPALHAAVVQTLQLSDSAAKITAARSVIDIAYADVGGALDEIDTDRIPWASASAFLAR